MSSITIQKTKDVELLASLNEEVQNWHHENFPEEFKAFNYKEIQTFFENLLNREDVYAFIALVNGKAIGYVFFYIVRKEENAFQVKRNYIHIDQIFVTEDFQKKGIGEKLMQEVEKIAETKNINNIRLDFWSKNNKAKNFFTKNRYNCFNYKMIKDLK